MAPRRTAAQKSLQTQPTPHSGVSAEVSVTEDPIQDVTVQAGLTPVVNTQIEASLDSTTTSTRESARDVAHFFEPKLTGNAQRACLYCKRDEALARENEEEFPRQWRFSPKTSNYSLRVHLDNYHRSEYLQLAAEHGWVVQLRSQKLAKQDVTRVDSRVPFSIDAAIDYIVKFIAANDQSLNVVENRQFRDLLTFFRPDFSDEVMPHRTKIRASIIEAWATWFVALKKDLEEALGELSFTMDMWSSKSRASYLCITVHYISATQTGTKQGLKLKSFVLAFHKLEGEHSGENIAETVSRLLLRAGIDPTRKFFWTLDNASNNPSFVKHFYGTHSPDMVDPLNFYIRCFPHIINIITQRTIKALEEISGGVCENDDDVAIDKANEVPTALLSKIRALIRAFRASGQRQEALAELIKKGNNLGYWTHNGRQIYISQTKLLLDVRTRWDSTYQMLFRLNILRQPLTDFCRPEGLAHARIKALALSPSQWEAVSNFIGVLQYPHSVQGVMAKEKTPVLAGAIPTFERFMTGWEKLIIKMPHLAPALETGLEIAREYYKRMDDTHAYVVAMFIHPGIRMSWFQEHWGRTYAKKAEDTIKSLMNSYRLRLDPAPEAPPSAPTSRLTNLGYANLGIPSDFNVMADEDLNWSEISFEAPSVDHEFKTYVDSPRRFIDTDLLKYWEQHAEEFPTIFQIAMDYLPIQASSVPCERAFSSSAETDTNKRNKLSPILMEALQMLKYSLKNEPLNFTANLITPEEALFPVRGGPSTDLLAQLSSNINEDAREDVMDRIIRVIEG